MVNEYTDVWRNKSKDPAFINFATRPEPEAKLDPFHLYQARDIYYGGHNNVSLSPEYKNHPFDEIIDSIINNDGKFPEFMKYYQALNSDNYLDEIKPQLLRAMLNEGSWDKMAWLEYHESHSLAVYPYYFVKYINQIDKSLYKDQQDE
jgi:hypothetical protein